MPDPADAFLDAAVRAFDDNAELQVIARRELAEAVETSAAGGDSFEASQARLDEVDASRSQAGRWLIGAVAVASLALAVWTALGLWGKRDEIRWFEDVGGFGGHEIPEEKLTAGLSKAERLLLLGDPEAIPEGDRMKVLWQSDPDNPAYLAEHARTWVAKEKSLPPEVLDAALRLEPDNGYIHYLAAVAGAPDCVKDITKPQKRGNPRPLPEYEITDEARFLEMLDHLRAAAAAPAFRDHQRDLLLRRLKLLPVPEDILSVAPKGDYLFGAGRPLVNPLALPGVLVAKAHECLMQGDRDGFLKLVETWDTLMPRLVPSDRPSMIYLLVLRGLASSPLNNFIATAEGLGLPEAAAELRARKEKLSREHSPIKKAINHDAAKRQAELHGGFFQQFYFHLNVPREEELRASRLAEYALLDRFASLAGWLVFVVAALAAACFRFRGSFAARRMSRRLVDLVRPSDLAWTIGAGVVLPFLLVLALVHLTPLGGRGWSLHASGGLLPVGQLLASVLLMLLTPVVIARQRLARRAGQVGLASGSPLPGWLAVAACAVALPMFGIAQWVVVPERLLEGSGGLFEGVSFLDRDLQDAKPPGAIWLWTALGLLAAAACGGVLSVTRSVFSRRRHLLRRLVLSRMLFPAYVAGSLVFAVAGPLYHATEKFWFARDMMTTFLPENHGLTPVEAELMRLEEAQLLEVLRPAK